MTLCTLPEPHDHIFLVPKAYSGKECICPFTGVHFMAPDLGHKDANDYEEVDLSHHQDRVRTLPFTDTYNPVSGSLQYSPVS